VPFVDMTNALSRQVLGGGEGGDLSSQRAPAWMPQPI